MKDSDLRPSFGASLPPGARTDPHPLSVAELAALPFFQGLSDYHLAELRPHTKQSFFQAGEPLLVQGELANRFYVIVSGRVAIECNINGETVRVQEVGPGESVGFSWSFTPETLHFTARALEPVKAVFFYGTLLQEDCELDPSLGYELALRAGRVLMGRMEALIKILKERLPHKAAQ
jgi:CRP/FNR family transcriptional regulator, cyclic AMP receptor protein